MTESFRLYVANFPPDTTRKELRTLVSKICPVSGVYKPDETATGIQRSFAIVNLEGTNEQLYRVISAYNKAFWKGAQLKVELSTSEYYMNRVERELEEEKEEEESKIRAAGEAQEAYLIQSSKIFQADEVRIRVSKDDNDPIVVSTVPRVCKALEKANKKSVINKKTKSVIPCGRKWLIDDDGYASFFSDALLSSKAVQKESSESATAGPKPIGGGARRGFGTLVKTTIVTTATAAAGADNVSRGCAEKEDDGDDKLMEKLSREKKLRSEYDMEVDEMDRGDNGYYDRLSDDDEMPSVLPTELTEESLLKERQRSMNLLSGLLKSLGHNYGGNNGNSSSGDAATTDKAADSTHQKDENSNGSGGGGGDEVNDQQQQQGELAAQASGAASLKPKAKKGWETVSIMRFDPTKDVSSMLLSTEEVEARNVAAEERRLSSAAAADDLLPPPQKQTTTVEGESKEGENFADLGTLKNIFYKDGGVFWGDDVATIDQAVNKGSIANDALFREAEKVGIDIRGDSAAAAGGVAPADSLFSFGFGFGAEAPASQPAVEVLPCDTSASAVVAGASSSSPADMVRLSSENDTAYDNDLQPTEVAADAGAAAVEEDATNILPMSLIDVISNAMLFAREKSIETIMKEWREKREKLMVDYKRKRKEARKRSGNSGKPSYSSFNSRSEITTVAVDAASQVGGGFGSSSGSGGAAGSWKSDMASKRSRGGKGGVRGKFKKARKQ